MDRILLGFNMGKKFKLNPKIIITISLIIGIVMISSAYLELKQSKEEIFHLLHAQAVSLIETISLSSINTLNSSYEIEELIAERLLNNARLIKKLDSLNSLTQKKLVEIGKENNLFRINIFDEKGNRVLSNRIPTDEHIHPEGNVNRSEELKPILQRQTDEIIIGLKDAQYSKEQRYAAAVSRSKNRGAIVVNLDAKQFLDFRKKIGIGKIIQDMGKNSGIEFIALQDRDGILAASKNVDSLSAINEDSFLRSSLNSDSIFTRIIKFNSIETYEVIKRLVNDNEVVGIYRIGLSLNEVRSLEARMYRRIIIISLILAAISIIVLSILFTAQNLRIVSNEYKNFKTFTGSILQNMAEAVIVLNNEFQIILFNKFSENLFNVSSSSAGNKNINEILEGKLSFVKTEIQSSIVTKKYFERLIEISNSQKILGVSITENYNKNENEIDTYTIVITDLTQSKNLEEHVKRQEKLSAMGELASGVAHEIRNPINSIGMIAQRLKREFEPKNEKDEYEIIIKVLRDEVDRVNKIISQFLNYAKPIELQRKSVSLKNFINEITFLFYEQAKIKNIDFKVLNEERIEAEFDPELMKQSLINLIQNAFDAVNSSGNVFINYYLINLELIIEIIDSGGGISNENKSKIFNLYYTTKPEGNGLGLSITQKIISQHNGFIKIENNFPQGTIFKLIIPQNEKH